MKFHLVILSVACLSCLVPSGLGDPFHATVLGGLLAKGALLKAKTLLGTKAAVKTGALLGAKGLAAKSIIGASIITKPVVKAHIPPTTVVLHPPHISSIVNRILRLQTILKPTIVAQHVVHKEETVVPPSFHFLTPELIASPKYYEEHNVEVPCDPEPEIIVSPLIQEHSDFVQSVVHREPEIIVPKVHAAPAPPSVAIIGPTMNVYQHPINNAYSV